MPAGLGLLSPADLGEAGTVGRRPRVLYVINRNLWALEALPLIFAAGQVKMSLPRGRLTFYVYYPAHLAVLWIVARLL